MGRCRRKSTWVYDYADKYYSTSVDELWMSDSEICKRYKDGKDKGEMLMILAEMCLCTRKTIVEVLNRNGIDAVLVRRDFSSKRGRKKLDITDEERLERKREREREYYRKKISAQANQNQLVTS